MRHAKLADALIAGVDVAAAAESRSGRCKWPRGGAGAGSTFGSRKPPKVFPPAKPPRSRWRRRWGRLKEPVAGWRVKAGRHLLETDTVSGVSGPSSIGHFRGAGAAAPVAISRDFATCRAALLPCIILRRDNRSSMRSSPSKPSAAQLASLLTLRSGSGEAPVSDPSTTTQPGALGRCRGFHFLCPRTRGSCARSNSLFYPTQPPTARAAATANRSARAVFRFARRA
jgi:hypothetical protein